MKAAGAPQEPCEAESKIETADKPKQRNGIQAYIFRSMFGQREMLK